MQECLYCKKPVDEGIKYCTESTGSKCRAKYHRSVYEAGQRALGKTLPEIAEQQGAPSFHNTIRLTGEALTTAERKAENQEDEILIFFQSHTGMYTPAEVAEHFPMWPITSVRRSITNLTTRGELVKTHVKRKGAYGMETHCWCVA